MNEVYAVSGIQGSFGLMAIGREIYITKWIRAIDSDSKMEEEYPIKEKALWESGVLWRHSGQAILRGWTEKEIMEWPGCVTSAVPAFRNQNIFKNSDTAKGEILCLRKYRYQESAIQNGSV